MTRDKWTGKLKDGGKVWPQNSEIGVVGHRE